MPAGIFTTQAPVRRHLVKHLLTSKSYRKQNIYLRFKMYPDALEIVNQGIDQGCKVEIDDAGEIRIGKPDRWIRFKRRYLSWKG